MRSGNLPAHYETTTEAIKTQLAASAGGVDVDAAAGRGPLLPRHHRQRQAEIWSLPRQSTARMASHAPEPQSDIGIFRRISGRFVEGHARKADKTFARARHFRKRNCLMAEMAFRQFVHAMASASRIKRVSARYQLRSQIPLVLGERMLRWCFAKPLNKFALN